MKTRHVLPCIGMGIAAWAAGPALSQFNPAARYAPVSPPDCAGPSNLISEGAQEPVNETHMRIQHMGDPGSDELNNEIARVVTWDVSGVTGLRVPVEGQRGSATSRARTPSSSGAATSVSSSIRTVSVTRRRSSARARARRWAACWIPRPPRSPIRNPGC